MVRITGIVERAVRLDAPGRGGPANAVVDFSGHTVSLVAVLTDAVRRGRPVAGVAFDSIGRFAQSGILRDRLIPRVLAAAPDALLDGSGFLDPAAVAACALTDEKPGGHGDRAAAVAALELACWDLNAKLRDEPASVTIARHAGRQPAPAVPVYAAGGYYRPAGGVDALRREMGEYLELGYRAVKMKIGGAALGEDLARVEAVIDVVGDAGRVAVDANGRFGRAEAIRWADALAGYGLRWFEEPGDPLDYALHRAVTDCYDGPVATGENLFSVPDVTNLVRYGGMRPDHDVFQMDPGLSYGLSEYLRMLDVLADHGFHRGCAFPHGGHLINLHVAAGLGLGGCEAYPGVFAPFGGYPDGCVVSSGMIAPPDAAGFGLEQKPGLAELIAELTGECR
ncbi:mandelate racemase/muconate lactonizing enzyme family protein [Mycobacterium avium]|uniref:mandelate racemase/muconate lactonizing enzyme family protein n=1 Tax=Mycobacterium avium TaxID=1764 RepID=UPI0018C32FEB|nr:mandelate racemase/muconate lactonizing enzyme family protein [Mycobacterium avium]MBG0727196.1 mandelate racemase [Mycobacterium avium]